MDKKRKMQIERDFRDITYVGDITRGFVLEDTRNGELTLTNDDVGTSVTYTHKRPISNSIWFFAVTGERGLVNVISVPIHDHSSVVMGGPAYGTYFDDDVKRVS